MSTTQTLEKDSTAAAGSPVPPADAIINSLKDQANTILAAFLGSSKLKPFNITGKGNMPYYWQNPRNLEFNKNTYDWIDSNLTAGVAPLQLDSIFANYYLDALSKVSFSLSTNDQATLNQAMSNATDQQAAVLTAWKSAFGSFPDGTGQPIDNIATTIATTWANPPTTLTAIQQSININQLLNQVPASGKPVVPVFANWLNAIGAAVPLENSVTMGNAYLAKALAAVQSPSQANGALKLDSGSSVPAYQVSTSLKDILNGLKETQNAATISMTVTRVTQSEYRVSLQGGASFSIPVASFFTVNVGGQASYFENDIATSSNQTTVEMSFPGVTLVNFGPVDFSQSTLQSWYWMKPITDAIANGSKDVTGYKFSPKPQIDFSTSGPFGFLVGTAISNYPSLKITVKSSSYASIQKTFQQSASVGLSFLGIPLGIGGSEGSYSNQVTVDASASTVTITLTPPKDLVAGAAVDSVGWVLGVQPRFPAA